MGKARVSVVMIIKRVWLCLLLLLNVGCGLIRPMFSPESKVGEPGSTLSPSSALAQNELENLFQRALNDASFRKVKEKLEGRGFVPIYDSPFGWAYERGSILFLPFRPASGERGAPGEEPLPSSKPKSPGGPKPGQPRRPPELPKHPTPTSADPAYAIYVAYVDGPSLAFGVVDEGNTTVNVLPDVDRSLLSPDVRGEEVLGQLRANERFRKFEDHHASQGGSLWARIVIDETSRTAYILVTVGMPDPATTPYSLKPPEPPVVKPDYVVTACYLGVCPALSYGSGQTTLDVSKLELFHAGEDALRPSQFTQDFDGIKVAELGEPVLYTIYAGGEKPTVLDLPGFGFYSVPHHDDYELMPHPLAHYGEGGGRALNLVLWGLLDLPANNVLLQFKTDLELTLEAYNRIMSKNPDAVGMLIAKEADQVGYLLNLKETKPSEVVSFYKAGYSSCKDFDSKYVKISLDTLAYFILGSLTVSLEELVEVLLELAEAARAGNFYAKYKELLPQGLKSLEDLLIAGVEDRRPEAREQIRRLALEVEAYFLGQQPLQPKGVGAVLVGFAKWLTVKILEALLKIGVGGIGLSYLIRHEAVIIEEDEIQVNINSFEARAGILNAFHQFMVGEGGWGFLRQALPIKLHTKLRADEQLDEEDLQLWDRLKTRISSPFAKPVTIDAFRVILTAFKTLSTAPEMSDKAQEMTTNIFVGVWRALIIQCAREVVDMYSPWRVAGVMYTMVPDELILFYVNEKEETLDRQDHSFVIVKYSPISSVTEIDKYVKFGVKGLREWRNNVLCDGLNVTFVVFTEGFGGFYPEEAVSAAEEAFRDISRRVNEVVILVWKDVATGDWYCHAIHNLPPHKEHELNPVELTEQLLGVNAKEFQRSSGGTSVIVGGGYHFETRYIHMYWNWP